VPDRALKDEGAWRFWYGEFNEEFRVEGSR
jgi:hypothetical protein